MELSRYLSKMKLKSAKKTIHLQKELIKYIYYIFAISLKYLFHVIEKTWMTNNSQFEISEIWKWQKIQPLKCDICDHGFSQKRGIIDL